MSFRSFGHADRDDLPVPCIVSVTMVAGDDQHERVAAYWRTKGWRVSIFSRSVRAKNIEAFLWVVVVTGKRKVRGG